LRTGTVVFNFYKNPTELFKKTGNFIGVLKKSKWTIWEQGKIEWLSKIQLSCLNTKVQSLIKTHFSHKNFPKIFTVSTEICM
jgi:hypothetical protein